MTAVISPPEGGSTTLTVREPDLYGPRSRDSLLTDMVLAKTRSDDNARERLARHAAYEQRVNPNTTLGTGGEFAPPAWLISRFKTAARIGRPFANAVCGVDENGNQLDALPLPSGVAQINVPKWTTSSIQGSNTGVQPAQGAAEQEVDNTTAALTSQVVTIAGEFDVSQQLYDLTPSNPGFDTAAFTDLQRDYNANLENQLILGSGANGQLGGITSFSPPGSNVVSGTSATSVDLYWPLLGQVGANIGNNRGQLPEFWVMSPRRWMWLASGVDSSKRPLSNPRLMDMAANLRFEVATVPTIVTGALNTGTNPDNTWAVRPSEFLLWESDPKLAVVTNSLSGTLQVRLRYYKYVAFIANAYTSGLGVLQNVPRPSGF